MRSVKTPANMRGYVENYFSAPMPKALVISQRGATYWSAKPNDLEGARKQALANCRAKTGADRTVATENNALVLPATDPFRAFTATRSTAALDVCAENGNTLTDQLRAQRRLRRCGVFDEGVGSA
jgi:hypothetical protein